MVQLSTLYTNPERHNAQRHNGTDRETDRRTTVWCQWPIILRATVPHDGITFNPLHGFTDPERHNHTVSQTDGLTDRRQYDANSRSYSVQQYLVDLVEYSNIVTELERRAEHDDEGRKHQVYVQTLQTSSPSSSLSSS